MGPTWEPVVQLQALGESEQVKPLARILPAVFDCVNHFTLADMIPHHIPFW